MPLDLLDFFLLEQSAGGLTVTNFGGLFGDGSDGAVILDGSTTYAFASLAANVYTLSAPIMASSLIINSGVTLKPAGWGISCTGTVTNNGTISELGNNASGATGGVSTSAFQLVAGGGGGNGGTGAGAAGQSFGHALNGFGQGGNGGASGGNGGGSGAGGGPMIPKRIRFPTAMINGLMQNTGQVFPSPGGGGGSGGGDGANAGGGGGGGGGFVAIWANALVNNGSISVNGGNGGNGVAGNAGGGGGGGGGNIIAYTPSAWTQGTMTANGGTKGTHAGTGADGVNGQNGLILNVILV